MFRLLDVQLLVFLAVRVVDRRAAKREGLDLEHGVFDGRIHARDARVRRSGPWRGRSVVHRVLESDGVIAAPEHEGLGHRDAVAIRPSERHTQFVLARRELVAILRARETGDMRGPCLVGLGAGEAALHHVVSRGIGLVEQHHRLRLALDQRIGQELGVHQRAAAQIDVHDQHVGGDTHLARAGGLGRRAPKVPRRWFPVRPRSEAHPPRERPAGPPAGQYRPMTAALTHPVRKSPCSGSPAWDRNPSATASS